MLYDNVARVGRLDSHDAGALKVNTALTSLDSKHSPWNAYCGEAEYMVSSSRVTVGSSDALHVRRCERMIPVSGDRTLMRRIANEEHCDRETASVVWTHGGIRISIEKGRLSELE